MHHLVSPGRQARIATRRCCGSGRETMKSTAFIAPAAPLVAGHDGRLRHRQRRSPGCTCPRHRGGRHFPRPGQRVLHRLGHLLAVGPLLVCVWSLARKLSVAMPVSAMPGRLRLLLPSLRPSLDQLPSSRWRRARKPRARATASSLSFEPPISRMSFCRCSKDRWKSDSGEASRPGPMGAVIGVTKATSAGVSTGMSMDAARGTLPSGSRIMLVRGKSVAGTLEAAWAVSAGRSAGVRETGFASRGRGGPGYHYR